MAELGTLDASSAMPMGVVGCRCSRKQPGVTIGVALANDVGCEQGASVPAWERLARPMSLGLAPRSGRH